MFSSSLIILIISLLILCYLYEHCIVIFNWGCKNTVFLVFNKIVTNY